MTLSSTLSSKRPAAHARRAFAFPVRRALGAALLAAWTFGAMPVHAQTPASGAAVTAPAGAADDDALTQSAFSPAFPDEKKDLPGVTLSAQIVYQVLAAEVALQRAQPAPAFQTYLALARDTKDPRMAQRATEIALAAQSPADALAAANLWREYAPDSNRAAQVDAALLVLAGKPLDAEPLLGRELARTNGDNRGDAILALQALIARGPNRVDGLTVLQHLLKDDLIRPEARLAIARQQLAVDDKPAAVTSLKQALELKPDYLPAALMLSQMGPDERAIGVASFEKYVQQNPKAREGRLALAQLYLADNRLDDAQKQFETMHRNDPKEPAPLMALALIKIQQKQLDDASKYLKQYIDAAQKLPDADVGQAYVYLAQISVEQNNDAQASQWLDKIDPASPHYIPAQVTRAQILAKQGKVDDARKVLAGLQVNDPRDAAVIARTDASLLFSAKRYREAADRLAQAVDAFPDDPDLRYDYAMASEKIGQYTTMEQQLRVLMRAQPNDPQAYNALGYSLADRNQRLPEANELIEKASALAPKDAFIMDSLGWVKYRLGDNATAEKILSRAYSLQPNAEIGAHLGEVLWKSGQQDKARDAWRAAQKLEPDNDTLVNTLKRFEVQGL
ncbi:MULTISPECIES: tetratricopeptide repeat protein [unclassified Burkholderia]|uniref:tetratricopeptide repeat protein n=1 Tax=unclassified Burkholderia TaxID=2613784 RepID=UPI000469ABBB|nr:MULTISPECIES: tetratricopeptide repeat protein [unclassified Burkholderia]NIF89600.1 tetratricopeptide repeat protein [Burkholderia sp. Cy-637]